MEDRTEDVFEGGIQEDSFYEEFCSLARRVYLYNVKDIIGDDSDNGKLFSWYTNDLTIHFVHRCHNISKTPVIFATKYMGETFIVHDAIDLTDTFLLKNEFNSHKLIRELFEKDFFEFPSSEVISESIIYTPLGVSFQVFADSFVHFEYEQATKELKMSPIEINKFNEVRIHMDAFEFEAIFATIDDEQFKFECLECISAYNNEHFFVAATGLGAILEHLLAIILEKHQVLDNKFAKNPTYRDYLSYMRREPISIDRRSKSYIDSLFMLRNSVSHYNTGFSSKSVCDQMLHGIRNVFDNFYEL